MNVHNIIIISVIIFVIIIIIIITVIVNIIIITVKRKCTICFALFSVHCFHRFSPKLWYPVNLLGEHEAAFYTCRCFNEQF